MIALDFYFISWPLVFEPAFDDSLQRAVIGTTIACVLTIRWLRVPWIPWSALLFLAFAVSSSYWSINHQATVYFVGLYVVLTLLAAVVACNVEARVLSHGIMCGAAIVVVASIYAAWNDLPGADVPPGSSGFLAGVGTNRNILAYTMIIALAFAVSFLPRRRSLQVAWLVGLATVLSGIILAESVTGIAASAVLIATALVLGSRDRLVGLGKPPGRRYWAALAGILLALGATSVAWYEALHRELSRDLALTGRTEIWRSIWDASSTQVRLVGDGWGSVWPHPWRGAPPNGAYDEIVRLIGHTVAHGHNSAMDLVPELGLAGVAVFGLIYVQPLLRAVLLRRRPSRPAARETSRVAILGIVGLLLAGSTEPISTVPLGFFVAILIASHAYTDTDRDTDELPSTVLRTPEQRSADRPSSPGRESAPTLSESSGGP